MTEQGIAVIGAGMIGAAHAAGYRSHQPRFRSRGLDLRLATICDEREELAKAIADAYGFAAATTDWRRVMADDDIRIVSVALPNFLHAEVVGAALAARKHVLCEKPLALCAAEARRLQEQAEQAGVCAGTVFNYRRYPAITEIRNLLQAGEIGDPVHLLVQYQCEYAADPLLPHSWRYVRAKAGGGALHDIGTHAVDTARFLCGDIAEVRGAAASTIIARRYLPSAHTTGHGRVALSDRQAPVDTDDVVSSILLFENGCQGLFAASRVAPGMGSTLSFQLCGTRATVAYSTAVAGEYRIARLGGVFSIVPNRAASPYVSDWLPVATDGIPVGYGESFSFMIAEFLGAIADNKPFTNGSLEDGLRAAEILDAIMRSAELRRPVTLQEIRESP